MGPGEALLGLCEYNLKRWTPAVRHLLHAEKIGFGPDAQLRQVSIYHAALALILMQDYERALEQLTILVRTTEVSPNVRLTAGIAGLRRPILPDDFPEADRDLAVRLGEAETAEIGGVRPMPPGYTRT